MSNVTTLTNDEAPSEMDGLLHDYFQAETPKHWPAFIAPRPVRLKAPAPAWSRYAGRLALAACVALLVASYLTLAGCFPSLDQAAGLPEVVPPIAQKEPGKKAPLPKLNEKTSTP